MKRRTFLKNTGAAGIITLLTPAGIVQSFAQNGKLELNDLSKNFRTPPDSARAYTWWHWMNGAISKEGITLDLEAMKKAGLGGLTLFEVSECIKGWVDYGSEEHKEMLKHAAREANRIGLDYSAHNCPGFSSSGGPWNTPEVSMQQVVWTEMFISGGEKIEVNLAKPFAKKGYYRDAKVIAFPSIKGEKKSLIDRLVSLKSDKGELDKNLLSQANIGQGIDLNPEEGKSAFLLLEFAEPIEARAITLFNKAGDGRGGPPGMMGGAGNYLEASMDGVNYEHLCSLSANRPGMAGAGTDGPSIAEFKPTTAKYYKLNFSSAINIADVKLTSARLSEWTGKANYEAMGSGGNPFLAMMGIAPETPIEKFPIENEMMIDPGSVLDITEFMNEDGLLQWDVPQGDWTILRMGSTTVGVENHPYPDNGGGLECDKFSKEAIEHHLYGFLNETLPTLEAIAKEGKVGMLIDSYEVGHQNWTKLMPEEFENRNGYSLIKYLPTLTGRIVGSEDESERFLWDFRRTQSDMCADYYFGHFNDLCHQHGFYSLTEPYSAGPFEEMQAGSRVDIPMGEFWVGGGQLSRDISWIKTATSVAHINDQKVVGAESFTGMPTYAKWQQYPFSLKAEGDWAFCQGINRFYFHRYAHQPHPSAGPGMTMSRWGFHFDRTNTWFPKASGWLDYLGRCQYLLQQGDYVPEVAYFIGVDAPGPNPSTTDLKPELPAGIQYDTINMESILNLISVKNGKMVLPHGMSYSLLILPEKETDYTLPLLTKIMELVSKGMKVYGPRPTGSPGLAGYSPNDENAKAIINELWGDINGTTVTENSVDEGKIFYGKPIEDVLKELNVETDFTFTSESGDAAVHFIHKRTDETDIYFVANFRRRKENLVCSFNVAGKQPEIWDAVTGETYNAAIFSTKDGKTTLPLSLNQSGSAFIVFKDEISVNPVSSIKKDGSVVLSTNHFGKLQTDYYKNIQNNFSIEAWIKPELDFNMPVPGRMNFGGTPANYAFYPASGTKLFGEGHSAIGLSAARTGVLVYERSSGSAKTVLTASKPLSGWTHIVVNYENGVPSIFINGEFAQKGEKSEFTVHPGIKGTDFADGSFFYWGDFSKPKVYNEVLNQSKIKELSLNPLPAPEKPFPLEITGNEENSAVLFWEEGEYSIQKQNGGTEKINVAEAGKVSEITESWKLAFPENMGAPKEIQLSKLMSLHKHDDDGVKYFSGTATYSNNFTVADKMLGTGKKLYLDLGRVEVLAQVIVNGKDLGIYWTKPYRVDISEAAKAGVNTLEIQVTNLWPNRLIGDEQIPAEYEYSAMDEVAGEGFGGITEYPDWYIKGEAKPAGKRIAFSAFKHYKATDPLLESGLVGPVSLYQAIEKKIN